MRSRKVLALALAAAALAAAAPLPAQPLADRYGDPLPEGALARLGSSRWRHDSAAGPAAFSPDGKLFALSGDIYLDASLVRVWDLSSGKEVRPFGGHRGGVTSLAPSADGKLAVTGSADLTARLWETATDKVLSPWVEAGRGRAQPEGAVIGAGGRLLIRPLSWQGAAELVSMADLETVLAVYPVVVPDRGIGFVACTPDGLWDASPGAERFVTVFGPKGVADAAARDARHDAAAIRARLREAWGLAGK